MKKMNREKHESEVMQSEMELCTSEVKKKTFKISGEVLKDIS